MNDAKPVLTSLDHFAISAQDPHRLARWYCDVLDYQIAADNGSGGYLIRSSDGTYLEIGPNDGEPRPQRTLWAPGWSHLALRVANLDQAIRVLESRGVEWAGDIGDALGGGRLRNFLDPEGNLLQIVERP
ncbi:MAG: VOC family protein [bacterium]|nr:VOC family protein [bacterium]